jgi:hypothetical protein
MADKYIEDALTLKLVGGDATKVSRFAFWIASQKAWKMLNDAENECYEQVTKLKRPLLFGTSLTKEQSSAWYECLQTKYKELLE